jgi:hypothetical protein
MFLAAPIWLLALIPWAGLAVWMLRGRRERVGVPFLSLWQDAEARPTTSRAVRPPPIAIALLLMTILLAILAASAPTISSPNAGQVTVLVDRGITMSARDGDAYRYQRAADMVTPHLGGRVEVVTVPHRTEVSTSIRSIPPTAVDTRNDVAQAVIQLLATTRDLIVVLTDQPIDAADPRMIVIPPPPLAPNAGIERVGARDAPAAQVMVRVGAAEPGKQTIVVSSDGKRVEQPVEGTAFLDLPSLGKTVEVAMAQGDALSADDRAWLVRETGWPRIEPIAALPPELARMIETYRKLRPAREDARVISIVDSTSAAVGDAVILAPATSAAIGSPVVATHPITAGVVWQEMLKDARLGDAPPAGFTPVVSIDNHTAVALREEPARQVWVALDAPSFARRADYVVFWTNVFDWLGRGGDAFVAHPIGLLENDWRRVTHGPEGTEPGLWPGIYQRSDGTLRAVNAPFVKPPDVRPVTDWQQRLAQALAHGRGGRALSPYLLLAALLCAAGAACCWPARKAAST